MNILIDVDGVLADFSGHYLDTLHRLTGVRAYAAQIDRWHIHECEWFPASAKRAIEDEIVKPGWCGRIPMFPYAPALVSALREIGTLYAVTSPWVSSPHWMHERTEWLHYKLGIRARHVVHAQVKHIIAGDILIDDKPAHVEEWSQSNQRGRGILFTAPHNRGHQLSRGVRASTNEEVIAHAREVAALRRELDLNGVAL